MNNRKNNGRTGGKEQTLSAKGILTAFFPTRRFVSVRTTLVALALVIAIPLAAVLGYAIFLQYQRYIDLRREQTDRLLSTFVATHEAVLMQAMDHVQIVADSAAVTGHDATACKRFTEETLANKPLYTALLVAGTDGTVWCSYPAAQGAVNIADRSYFKAALHEHRTFIGQFQVGRISGKYSIPVSHPVIGANGGIVGVAVLGVSFNWLDSLGSVVDLPPDTMIMWFTPDGTVTGLYPDNPDVVGISISDTPIFKLITATPPRTMQKVPAFLGINNMERYFEYENIPSHDYLEGLRVAVGFSTEYIFAPAREFERTIVPAIVVFFILAVLIPAFASDFLITRPLRQLVESTEQVTSGYMDVRIGWRINNEFALLADAFNRMADRLKRFYEDLEARVWEKTAALDRQNQEYEHQNILFQGILQSLPVGIIVARTPTGEFLLVNKKGTEMFRLPQPLPQGLDIPSFAKLVGAQRQDGSAYPVDELPLTTTLQTGAFAERNDVFVPIPDGGRRMTVNMVSAPVRDRRGQVVYVIMLAQDRTQEFLIDLAKTEFVSLASHQLRSPLSVMKWYTEMLLEGDAGPVSRSQREYLEEVYRSNQRMINLVGALLNVARIEMGTFSIITGPVELCDLAQSVIDEFKPFITQKRQRVTVKCSTGVPRIESDAKLLRVVIQNLLSNAIKYTAKEGSITIKLEPKKSDTEGQKASGIVLSVTDTGCGIPASQKGKIFTKFFRADNAQVIDPDGNGLGLYVIKNIVEQLDGTISFESVENKGTTFTVALPLSGVRKRPGSKELDSEYLLEPPSHAVAAHKENERGTEAL